MKIKGEGKGPLPPLLIQYLELCEKYPDYLVLFQVGDFYECFGEDAEKLARLLGLILTHKSSKDFVTPMAGMPLRAADKHIEKLLKMGIRVAVADQIGNIAGADGLVKREIKQLITPGTVTDENLLKADANYLAAIATGDGYGLALLDISTGEFRGTQLFSQNSLFDELMRYNPSEVLLSVELYKQEAFKGVFNKRFPIMLSSEKFDDEIVEQSLEQFNNFPKGLKTALRRAAGAVYAYALETQQGNLPHVNRFVHYNPSAYMQLDEVTISTLEIFDSTLGNIEQTVFNVLDQTRTAPGRRLLKSWLRHPLLDKSLIELRQNAVEAFVHDTILRQDIRKSLYKMYDLERLSSRISTKRASARDLVALARSLKLLPEIKNELSVRSEAALSSLDERLNNFEDIQLRIQAAVFENPPLKITEGDIIQDGFDQELDILRKKVEQGRNWIAELELKERQKTGIPNLKIGFNGVFGYYLETSRTYYDKIPDSYRTIQTLKDRQRYTRADLREKEREILRAEDASKKREYIVFNNLRNELQEHAEKIRELAAILAELDCISSLAEVAAKNQYCRPKFSTDNIELASARHAVVEQYHDFIANDLTMSQSERFIVLTGPNMSGKSTYLRQTALIAVLAQIGSFVPAQTAQLPIFSHIFTRIGASDDIAGGRSTFMVEMNELARILKNANQTSLVLLDEVGRGTGTNDGLAIAWAASEYLHNNLKAFSLFATHYFELSQLVNSLASARNYHVAAQEEENGLVFYHQVLEGAASKSYGLEVSKLAGLPEEVLKRAKAIFASLEQKQNNSSDIIVDELLNLDLSQISPLEALNFLHQLQNKAYSK